MAQQVINVGAAPNDGTGDPLRTAYIKTNDNFGELYSRAQTNPPASLYGSLGDLAGMYAYDENYFYYCYQDFDGSSQIWNQVSQIGNVSVTQIASGTTEVSVGAPDANVSISVNGVTNVAVITDTGISVTGNTTTTENITGGNLYSLGLISSTGTVTAPFFVGNGAFLTGISGSSYGDSNVALFLSTSSSNIVPAGNAVYSLGSASYQWKDLYVSNATIYMNSVPITVNSSNVLQVGGQAVLTNGSSSSVSTTGTVQGAVVSATGNVQAGNLRSSGSISATGNINSGNLLAAGIVSATGNISGGNLSASGNVSAGNINVTGNISGSNIVGTVLASASTISALGNITGSYLIGNGSQLTGILATNVGTLASLSVTGNTVSGNLNTAGLVSAAGNITGNYLIGNGSALTGIVATNVGTLASLSVTGNTTSGNLNTVGLVSAAGNVVSGNILTAGIVSAVGNITGNYILGNGSLLTGVGVNSYGNAEVAAYLPTYTGELTALTGNITTTGNISANSVISSTVFITNTVSAAGNIRGGNIVTAGSMTATGNINVGNLVSTGLFSTTGNINGGFIVGNGFYLTGVTASSVGEISSGNVFYTAPYTSAVGRTGRSKWADTVSVKDFGAVGDVFTDDTAAIQAALATGKSVYIPTGTYRLSNALSCTTPGQIIYGDGRTRTVLYVDNISYSFNLAASGVIVFNSGEPGPTLKDFGISFEQPDTATRGSLVNYPPAIYARSTPRFQIINCRITRAMTGIDMLGNSGGATIDGLEMSAFNFGVLIDGSLDTVRVQSLQYWPFGLSGNQSSIFFDASNVGIRCGRCDDLKITSCLFINGGSQVTFINGTFGPLTGPAFGAIIDTDFDNQACLRMNQVGGIIAVTNCYFTIGDANDQPIILINGSMKVVGCDFQSSVIVNNYQVLQDGPDGSSYLQVIGCRFINSGPGAGFININNGDAIINDNQFITPPNASYANPLIWVTNSGRVTFNGNRSRDKGTGTGSFITCTVNNAHIITSNQFLAWSLGTPGSTSSMIIANNGAVA